ncbi:MAG: hypothetical protein KDA44_01505 [Planctomycetales bacterium]|nr:hypothetical protein [Planctomycetales bacterium]
MTHAAHLQFECLEERRLLAVAAVGGEALVNDLIIREQSTAGASTAVAVANGNSIVAFAGKGRIDRDGVFAKVLAADGTTVVASFRVNTTIHGIQSSPAVAADAAGNFVVAWAGRGAGDKQGVFFQRYDAAGVAQGGETLVNETTGGAQFDPAVAVATDGAFVVTWSGVGGGDFAGVFMRRFDASGVAQSGETPVNSTTDDQQTEPAAAFDAAGNLAIAWTSRHQDVSDLGVFAQRYDAAGNALGAEFGLSATTAASQSAPALATNPMGGFYAAWTSFGQDGDRESVVGRAFSNTGAATTDELVLNDQTAGRQKDVSVAVDARGAVLAAWSSGVADGSGWEVRARSLLPAGTPDGASFAVNQNTAGPNSGHQNAPAVAITGMAAAIAWSGNGAADHNGVFLRSFTTDEDGPQVAPVLAPVAAQAGTVGVPLSFTVTATDENFNDLLGIQLDPDNAPALATLMQAAGARTATISYTPVAADAGQTLLFRVNVSDNGDPALSDTIDVFVTISAAAAPITASGSADTETDEAALDAAFSLVL